MTSYFHAAPWDKGLLTTTILTTILCLGIGMFLVFYGRRIKPVSRPGGIALQALGIVHIAIPLAFALFTVRGFTIAADAIHVHRLFW